MSETKNRKLKIFLCHASQDKPAVRELYQHLKIEGWIDPWLDEEELLPGQDWNFEIVKGLRAADVIIICLSSVSVPKEGYVQKEIKRALDIADEKPDGIIYIVPLKLDTCDLPYRLEHIQALDYSADGAYDKLLRSMRLRAEHLGLSTERGSQKRIETGANLLKDNTDFDFYKFIKIDANSSEGASYAFWISKYPVTNAQYQRFLNADDFANGLFWLEFPKYDEREHKVGNWGDTPRKWLIDSMKDSAKYLAPEWWDDPKLGVSQPNNPVLVTWYEANAYCEWLNKNWKNLIENVVNSELAPVQVRLSLESEWVLAAGGDSPKGRYPWDVLGEETTSLKKILNCTNVRESGMGVTVPVDAFPDGISPFGLMDMAGNCFEWQANLRDEFEGRLAFRGGPWDEDYKFARVAHYGSFFPSAISVGFRIVILLE